MEKRQVICGLGFVLIVIYVIKISTSIGKVETEHEHICGDDLKIGDLTVHIQSFHKDENKHEVKKDAIKKVKNEKNFNNIKKFNNKKINERKISEKIIDNANKPSDVIESKKSKDDETTQNDLSPLTNTTKEVASTELSHSTSDPSLVEPPSQSVQLEYPPIEHSSLKPPLPYKPPHLRLNKLNLKCNQEIIHSPYDLLNFEIRKFINVFRKGKSNREMKNTLIMNTKRFYRMGTSLGDVLYFFMLISQTDENSCGGSTHKQNTYKLFIMLYTNKLLQTSAINEIMKKGTDTDSTFDSDSTFSSDSTFDSDSICDEQNHGFYVPYPKNTFIDYQTLSTSFSHLISELSSILDQMPLKVVTDTNSDLLQNLINVMNCFYVRLQSRLNEDELKELVEIYKEMLMHLKKAMKIIDYIKRGC